MSSFYEAYLLYDSALFGAVPIQTHSNSDLWSRFMGHSLSFVDHSFLFDLWNGFYIGLASIQGMFVKSALPRA